MAEALPPETQDSQEVITFFPTVELLEQQANYLWGGTDNYYIGFSRFNDVQTSGNSSYLIDTPSNDLVEAELSKVKFSSDDIELVYSESSANFYANFIGRKILKTKPSAIKSVYIAKGTQPILGGIVDFESGSNTILMPFKDTLDDINVGFFQTNANNYYLGLAKGVSLISHSAPSSTSISSFNYVLFNSTADFLDKSISSFDSNPELATHTQLTPIAFEYGTLTDRPSVMINFGTAPISVNGAKNDLTYDCLFIFKSSVTAGDEDKNIMVCYAAPLASEFYLFGVESSKAMFDDTIKAIEITEHQIKTELAWEVIVF